MGGRFHSVTDRCEPGLETRREVGGGQLSPGHRPLVDGGRSVILELGKPSLFFFFFNGVCWGAVGISARIPADSEVKKHNGLGGLMR